jgi:hypothetical protein
VTTPWTAFPSDGFTARWQTWDEQHAETLTLRWENEGWTATGEVGREAVTYVLRLSATWHVRQFLLFRDLDEPDLWLGTDGRARWGEVNGAWRTDLTGCTDIDLACTPFTTTIPLRRLQLEVGEHADVTAATVDVETLSVIPVLRRYHRVGPRRFTTTDPVTGVTWEYDVDPYGLVHDVHGDYRRR